MAVCENGAKQVEERQEAGSASLGPGTLSVEELAQIGGGCLHFQLEGGVTGHVEGLALMVAVPLVFIGQLDGEGP